MADEDILDGDGETGSGDAEILGAAAIAASEGGSSESCLSCGGDIQGVFCPNCGQKNDDLRRSLFILGRDFIEDTFSFDSRMWRTLGLLAAKPGLVPTSYSHGKRSAFTPPVRLFLVVSFLFFLTIAATNILFVGLEVIFKEAKPQEQSLSAEANSEEGVTLEFDQIDNCKFQGQLRFFIKESDIKTDRERLNACMNGVRETMSEEIKGADSVVVGEDTGIENETEEAIEIVDRVFEGISWAAEDPRAFNDAFNNWLPRVMFFMTPLLALILTLFLRRKALIFDHMVFSLYIHAVNFVIVGAALVLGQVGLPATGVMAILVGVIYYVIAIKQAYGRGWAKTIWTAIGSMSLYSMVFSIILLTIVSRIVWQAAGGS